MSVEFFTFSYRNPARETRMKLRFANEQLNLNFVQPVEIEDSRLIPAPPSQKRTWAIMWSHLDMLKTFVETDADYGIFCEDDITIRRGLKELLPEITSAYNRLNLEILLLGYLVNYRPVKIGITSEFKLINCNFIYMNYSDNVWGSQMYMLDRKTARKFLTIYTVEYAMNSELDKSIPYFSPDWTLTKNGKRAAIYPMLAVEEGQVATSHQGQAEFHRQCHEIHFDENYH
jgi:hypothetical protein